MMAGSRRSSGKCPDRINSQTHQVPLRTDPKESNPMSFQRPFAVILIVALLLSTGCASKGRVAVGTPNEPTYGQVKPGDTVTVETPDGKRVRLVVEQISPSAQAFDAHHVVRIPAPGGRQAGTVARPVKVDHFFLAVECCDDSRASARQRLFDDRCGVR